MDYFFNFMAANGTLCCPIRSMKRKEIISPNKTLANLLDIWRHETSLQAKPDCEIVNCPILLSTSLDSLIKHRYPDMEHKFYDEAHKGRVLSPSRRQIVKAILRFSPASCAGIINLSVYNDCRSAR